MEAAKAPNWAVEPQEKIYCNVYDKALLRNDSASEA
jgi:hypothetical protein